MVFDQTIMEKPLSLNSLRYALTPPAQPQVGWCSEGWWVRGCASAEGKNINFDVFLRLLAEFRLAGLVGQVSGPPWLRGNFCSFEFMSAFSLWLLSVHFRSSGVPFLGP